MKFIIDSSIPDWLPFVKKLHDPPKKVNWNFEVGFHRVPYNQIFDFVTGQFVKILSPACSRKISKNVDNS